MYMIRFVYSIFNHRSVLSSLTKSHISIQSIRHFIPIVTHNNMPPTLADILDKWQQWIQMEIQAESDRFA